jgi:hypothetical protein
MGKGASTTTSQQSAAPQAQAEANLGFDTAQAAAQQPYQYYPGQLVAPLNADQGQAISTVANANGIANPYINAASDLTSAATQPIGASQINQYMNPYIADTVDTTASEINQNNAIQQNQLQGNAASLGALGGNRVGVAQAQLANQQDLAENSTLSGLYSSGYNTALTAAQTQNSQDLQGAYEYGNLGTTAQNAALTGANAQLETGGIEQQQVQNQDNQAYSQWEGAQQYPFQTGEYLTNAASSLAPIYGGTSSTTTPAPSTFSQVVGGLTSVAGIAGALKRGGAVKPREMTLGDLMHYVNTGIAVHRALGGLAHYDDGGWVAGHFGGPQPPAPVDPNAGTDGSGKAGGGRIGRDSGGDIPYQTGSVAGQDLVGNTRHAGYIPALAFSGEGHFGGPSAPGGADSRGAQTPEASGTEPLTEGQIQNLGSLVQSASSYINGTDGPTMGGGIGGGTNDSSIVEHQGGGGDKRGGRIGRDIGGGLPPPPPPFDPNAGTDGSKKPQGGSGGSGLGGLIALRATGGAVHRDFGGGLPAPPPPFDPNAGTDGSQKSSGGSGGGAGGLMGLLKMLDTGGRVGLASGGTSTTSTAASNSSATPSTTTSGGLSGLTATLTGDTPTEGQNIENYQFISPLIATGRVTPVASTAAPSPLAEEQQEGEEIATDSGKASGGRIRRTAGGASTAATAAPQLPTPQYAGAGLQGNAPQPATTAGTNPTSWGSVAMPTAPQLSAPQGAAPGTGSLATNYGAAAQNFINSYSGSQDPYAAYIQSLAGSNPSTGNALAPTMLGQKPPATTAAAPQAGLASLLSVGQHKAGGRIHRDLGGLANVPQDQGLGALPAPVTQQPLGPSPSYTSHVNAIESGGNPNASNPNSSAAGLGGITTPTMQAIAPNLVNGKTPAQIAAEKATPGISDSITTQLAQQNAKYLQANNLPVNDGTLYLAHNFGAGGAHALLTSDPAAPASSVLPKEDITSNPDLVGQTVGQVIASRFREMGQAVEGMFHGTQVAQNDDTQSDAGEPGYGGDTTGAAPLPLAGADQGLGNLQGQLATAQQGYGLPQRAETRVDKIANSPWTALAEAGLATMAGTSPFASVNIGAGGLAGLQYLQGTQAQERANYSQSIDAAQTSQQLQQRGFGQQLTGVGAGQNEQSITTNYITGLRSTQPGITDAQIAAKVYNLQQELAQNGMTGLPSGGTVPVPGIPSSGAGAPQNGTGTPAAPTAYVPPTAPATPAGPAVPAASASPSAPDPNVLFNGQPVPLSTAMARAQSLANFPGTIGDSARTWLSNMNSQMANGKITDATGNTVPAPGANQTTQVQSAYTSENAGWTALNDSGAVQSRNLAQQQLLELSSAGIDAPASQYAPVQQKFDSTIQALAQIAGVKISGKITDQASAFDMIHKISTNLAANLTKGMGQTALGAFQDIQSAVPNSSLSSPQSYNTLIRSTGQQVQMANDLQAFGDAPAGNGMTTREAIQQQNPMNPYAWQDEFFKSHPPTMYSSRVTPLSIPADSSGNVNPQSLQKGYDYVTPKGNVYQWNGSGFVGTNPLGAAAQ